MVYEVFGMMLSRENSVNDSYLLPMWVRLIDYMIYLGCQGQLKSGEWIITHWETELGCRSRREEHLGFSFEIKERSITGQLQTLMLTLKQECIDSSNTTLLFKIWQFHKESAWNSGDPGLGRSPGEGNGNTLLNYRSFIIKTVTTKK